MLVHYYGAWFFIHKNENNKPLSFTKKKKSLQRYDI